MSIVDGFKRYALNTGFLIFEKMTRALVNLFVWAYVIRYLGPQNFWVVKLCVKPGFSFRDSFRPRFGIHCG